MKVLITIGSMSEKKFTRLFNIVEELCQENILNGSNVVAQVGFDKYKPKNFNAFEMIADEEFKRIIDESDLIISHAGTGTVTSCLKKEKKVIVFPRLSQYDEHYDDHQLELAELFSKSNYVMCATNKVELENCIKKIDDFSPKKFISNSNRINDMIIDFIEK